MTSSNRAFSPSLGLENFSFEDRPSCLDSHGPVFILGCPRSGTTFLSDCMSSIPGVRDFVGLLAPPRLMHRLGRSMGARGNSEILAIVRDIFWQQFWRSVYAKGDRVKQWIQSKISFVEMCRSPSLAGKIFCYKEPFLCFAAQDFAEEFPNSKFIHIVRDGRDNADSMERTYKYALSDEVLVSDFYSFNKNSEIGYWTRIDGFNFPWWVPEPEMGSFRGMSKYLRCVRLWVEMTTRALELRKTLPKNRYLEIRYEDLCARPSEIGKSLLQFLGIEKASHFDRKIAKTVSNSVKIAQKNLCRSEIEKANQIAGDLLLKLGYDL